MEKNTDIRFWRTNTGLEIDFIIGEGDLGIEIKATANAASKKLTVFRGDQNELDLKRKIVGGLLFPPKDNGSTVSRFL